MPVSVWREVRELLTQYPRFGLEVQRAGILLGPNTRSGW
jgi:hypothetical protein